MVTVKVWEDVRLILPESILRSLGLREGDCVEVRRQNGVPWLQRISQQLDADARQAVVDSQGGRIVSL